MLPRFAELLLHILHRTPELHSSARLAALSTDEWDLFISAAIRYRLAYQIACHLRAEPSIRVLVPEQCFSRLDETVRATVLHNLVQQSRLSKMLCACQADELPVMLVKGLWLTEVAYCNLQARSSGDIDLIFRQSDMPRFTHIARGMGFNLPANTDDICSLAPDSNEFSLIHLADQSRFDIHWALTHPWREISIDEGKLWRRSEIATLAGMPCRTLRLEDHLLYLCFHAAEHHRFAYVGPRALLDVAQLVGTPPRSIDWDDLIIRVHELGWQRATWVMLELVKCNLGISPPQSVLDELRPERADESAAYVAALKTLFIEQQLDVGHVGRIVAWLKDEPSIRCRAVYMRERIFPARDILAAKYRIPAGASGIYLLYPLHWTTLIRKYLPKFIRLLMGDPVVVAELERQQTINHLLDKRKIG